MESVLSNRKHVVSLPQFNVTKASQPKPAPRVFKTPDGLDPGVSLYERAIKKKEFIQQQLKKQADQLQELRMKECTFAPKTLNRDQRSKSPNEYWTPGDS